MICPALLLAVLHGVLFDKVYRELAAGNSNDVCRLGKPVRYDTSRAGRRGANIDADLGPTAVDASYSDTIASTRPTAERRDQKHFPVEVNRWRRGPRYLLSASCPQLGPLLERPNHEPRGITQSAFLLLEYVVEMIDRAVRASRPASFNRLISPADVFQRVREAITAATAVAQTQGRDKRQER
jgi:hypothetical protein